MAKQTIAQKITEELEKDGFELVGRTSGWFSLRKGSNLSRKLDQLGLDYESDAVQVRAGAKKQHRTEGTDLLIFEKKNN